MLKMRRPGIRISKTGQDGKQDKGNKMNEIENFDKMKTIFLRGIYTIRFAQ